MNNKTFVSIAREYQDILSQEKILSVQKKSLQDRMRDFFERNNIKDEYSYSGAKAIVIKSIRENLDKKMLEEDMGEKLKKYVKTQEITSIRISYTND